MKLSIYSLKKILFQGDASLLNCKTDMGEITVLDNHEPLITVLSVGVMKVVPAKSRDGEAVLRDRGAKFLPIKAGFLEVRPGNEARCIVEE